MYYTEPFPLSISFPLNISFQTVQIVNGNPITLKDEDYRPIPEEREDALQREEGGATSILQMYNAAKMYALIYFNFCEMSQFSEYSEQDFGSLGRNNG